MQEDLNAYQGAYTEQFPYHRDEEALLAAYARKIIERLQGQRGLRVLSLGIGGQRVSQAIRDRLDVTDYHILEGSADIIARYRAETSPPAHVSIHHTYFEQAHFDQPFDAIEMGFMLEHVDDPGLILRRFRAFLKPTGVLFAAVPNARSLHRLLGHSAGLLTDLYALSQYDRELGHKRYFDNASISRLVEESGYAILDKVGLVLKPLTTSQLQQLSLAPGIEDALINVGYELPDICNGVLLTARPA
ncbi:class I SAM-dependent methyltransferase [Dyella agri]|uniref:Class I SAM-dependent methyltransferase n=1 Tax=Dyella agri TaxID=1926869 RepID=A0ABW8KKY5_9GAMM